MTIGPRQRKEVKPSLKLNIFETRSHTSTVNSIQINSNRPSNNALKTTKTRKAGNFTSGTEFSDNTLQKIQQSFCKLKSFFLAWCDKELNKKNADVYLKTFQKPSLGSRFFS